MFKIHVDVSFDKHLDLESGHFPSDFLAEILCSFLISPWGDTLSIHLIPLVNEE